jgi:hypothetical protein
MQLVLDTNGDNKVSESEILTAAKEVLAKLHTAGVAGEGWGRCNMSRSQCHRHCLLMI